MPTRFVFFAKSLGLSLFGDGPLCATVALQLNGIKIMQVHPAVVGYSANTPCYQHFLVMAILPIFSAIMISAALGEGLRRSVSETPRPDGTYFCEDVEENISGTLTFSSHTFDMHVYIKECLFAVKGLKYQSVPLRDEIYTIYVNYTGTDLPAKVADCGDRRIVMEDFKKLDYYFETSSQEDMVAMYSATDKWEAEFWSVLTDSVNHARGLPSAPAELCPPMVF